jgi:hypothetical protein
MDVRSNMRKASREELLTRIEQNEQTLDEVIENAN